MLVGRSRASTQIYFWRSFLYSHDLIFAAFLIHPANVLSLYGKIFSNLQFPKFAVFVKFALSGYPPLSLAVSNLRLNGEISSNGQFRQVHPFRRIRHFSDTPSFARYLKSKSFCQNDVKSSLLPNSAVLLNSRFPDTPSFALHLKSMPKCRQIVTFAKFAISVEFAAFRIPLFRSLSQIQDFMANCCQIVPFAKFAISVEFAAFRYPTLSLPVSNLSFYGKMLSNRHFCQIRRFPDTPCFALHLKSMPKCRQIVIFAKFAISVEFTPFRIPPLSLAVSNLSLYGKMSSNRHFRQIRHVR